MNIYKYVKSINNTDIPNEYTVYTRYQHRLELLQTVNHTDGKYHPANIYI